MRVLRKKEKKLIKEGKYLGSSLALICFSFWAYLHDGCSETKPAGWLQMPAAQPGSAFGKKVRKNNGLAKLQLQTVSAVVRESTQGRGRACRFPHLL